MSLKHQAGDVMLSTWHGRADPETNKVAARHHASKMHQGTARKMSRASHPLLAELREPLSCLKCPFLSPSRQDNEITRYSISYNKSRRSFSLRSTDASRACEFAAQSSSMSSTCGKRISRPIVDQFIIIHSFLSHVSWSSQPRPDGLVRELSWPAVAIASKHFNKHYNII